MVLNLRSAISRARPCFIPKFTQSRIPTRQTTCILCGYRPAVRPRGRADLGVKRSLRGTNNIGTAGSIASPESNDTVDDLEPNGTKTEDLPAVDVNELSLDGKPTGIWDHDLKPFYGRAKLLPLLRALGCADDIPVPAPGKKNLGYTRVHDPQNRETRRREIWAIEEDQDRKHDPPGLTLAGMSVRFIYQKIWHQRHELHKAGYPFKLESFTLNKEAQEYLESRNADWSDFSLWAYVLLGRNGPEAISRLEWLCKRRNYRLPPFVINHTLRHLAGHNIFTMRTAITCVDKFLTRNEEIVKDLDRPLLRIDSVTKRIMFLRLFRLANYYFPRELLSVTKVFIKHVIEGPIPFMRNDVIFCNHLLWAMGDPPRLSDPYWSALPYILDAQVFLLRTMFKTDPVMYLDRKGFRGIVRTRLASPTTPSERGIIAQQSMNWPPWKEIVDGYDQTFSKSDPDNDEPNVGNAGMFLREMQRAGFPLQEWEQSAMVLSGREESGTPTVPRRTWFVAGDSSGKDNPLTIWQARIRATRTLNEAWHIFLHFMDISLSNTEQRGSAVHVYKEMFRKLLQARKQEWKRPEPDDDEEDIQKPRQKPKVGIRRFLPDEEWVYVPPEPKPDPTEAFLRGNSTTVRGPSPIQFGLNIPENRVTSIGDSRDLLSPPRNPARGAYVPSPPPTVLELWNKMSRSGIKADLSLTCLLIRHALTSSEADIFLEEWYSYSRRRGFKLEKAADRWRWWVIISPTELERLQLVNFGHTQPWYEKDIAHRDPDENLSETRRLSYATIELASAYIAGLTSTIYTPRKPSENLVFTQRLIFRRIPKAITLAKSFKIFRPQVWTAILKGLNYSRLPRSIFQSSHAKTGGERYALTGFWEGDKTRRVKFKDLNFCVAKIHEHLREHWAYLQDPALIYEFIIAAERGWEYNHHLSEFSHHNHAQEIIWTARNAVDLFEGMIGIRRADGTIVDAFESDGAKNNSNYFELKDDGTVSVKQYDPNAEPRLPEPPPEEVDRGTVAWEETYEELVKISSTVKGKSTLPPVVIPRSSHIHAYVRLLLKTAEGDYDPVVRLLRWMGRFVDFLDAKNRRLPIIALAALWDPNRVGMAVATTTTTNSKSKTTYEPDPKALERSHKNYETAGELVRDRLREWGGWATDVEVAAYNGEDWKSLRDAEKAVGNTAGPLENSWSEADDFDDLLG